MAAQHKIVLATTLHDAEGRMAPFVRSCGPAISSLFSVVCAVATERTAGETIGSIDRMPNAIAVAKPASWEQKMGRGRRLAVSMAVQEGSDFILHLDFDRLIHWILSYKDELITVLGTDVPANDFLIIGRTERAFGTHPAQQREPESSTNAAISRELGWKLDVASGCSSFRRNVGEIILRQSVSDDFGSTDTEWPLLAKMSGFPPGYIETEGLEFETPGFHAGRIREIGYAAWIAEMFDGDQLAYRRKLERASIEIINETPERLRSTAGGGEVVKG